MKTFYEIQHLLLLGTPSSLLLTFWWLLLDDEDDDDLFLSPREEYEYGSCLFVLDEILFTFLLLLELCLLSLSFSFDEDDDVRDEDVPLLLLLLLLLEGIILEVGAFELEVEYGICAFELEDEFFVLLDFFCLLLLDDVDKDVFVANGSVGRLERDDEWDNSDSFSGDDGESLEFASCEIGLYGGIGLTLPPFF